MGPCLAASSLLSHPPPSQIKTPTLHLCLRGLLNQDPKTPVSPFLLAVWNQGFCSPKCSLILRAWPSALSCLRQVEALRAEALDQLRLPGGLGRAEMGVQFWGSLLLAHGGEGLRERSATLGSSCGGPRKKKRKPSLVLRAILKPSFLACEGKGAPFVSSGRRTGGI